MDESRITIAEGAIWRRMFTGLRSSRRWQFWIKVLLILAGAAIGAIGGGLDGDLSPATGTGVLTLKGMLVIGGGSMAFGGGLLLLFVEDDVTAIVAAAREATAAARQYLLDRDTLLARIEFANEAAERLDRKRRERLSAIQQMLEVVEAALLTDADVGATADRMLLHSVHSIHKAVEYEGGDFFTISIFQRIVKDDGERLHRVAAQWSDPIRAAEGGRSWACGQGYTGVAWARAIVNPTAEVIESDTTQPHIAAEYPLDHHDPDRERLYRSVAAVPILVGADDAVWGVVTATSDRTGVFRRDPSALGTQNIQVIRDIARFAGLLAGIDHVMHRPRAKPAPKMGWFG